jgi:multidrug efflux system membrane fusion protein
VRRGAPNGVVTTFVYLVNADHTASVRPVTLGVVDGERVAVSAGLAAGDLVVTEGGDRLREGATVLLPSAAPSAPASASPPNAHPGAKPSGTHHHQHANASP